MADPTIKDLLIAIEATEGKILTAINSLPAATGNADVLAAVATAQSGINALLAQDQVTPPPPPPPVIPVFVSMSPTTATAAGGETITVTGDKLQDAGVTGVLVGKMAAKATVISNTSLTFINPAQPAGPEDVILVGANANSAVIPADVLAIA